MKKALAIFLLLLLSASSQVAQQDVFHLTDAGLDAVEEWRFADADKIADQAQALLAKETKADKKAKIYSFLAQYWFYKGDYQNSLSALNMVKGTGYQPDEDFEKFYKRIQRLAGFAAGSHEMQSEHFRFRWVDPRDEVMAKPGLEVLEKAYQALGKDFNFFPAGEKILVDIYPRPEDLASAVDLEDKMIKDSGTIAICKFRRLMLASPRAALFGYDYQTTLCHELAHFFVYSRNGDTVPIWFHEGLAKYEDGSYKGEAGLMDPVAKSFIASAIKNNELISFEQMHPSFARFKTPKQGQLAFAEVETMVDYMRNSCGSDSWFKMLDLLKSGKNDKVALEQVCGKPFNEVWNGWKKYVTAKNWQVFPGAMVMKLEFKEHEGMEEAMEVMAVKGAAYEYTRLGDLLRDRSSYQAASVEYKKALEYEPYNAKIMNKLGLARILAGNYKEALEPLSKLTEIYPGYSTGFVNLGWAYFGLKDDDKAIIALNRALVLNPFNPTPYQQLYDIYQKRGDAASAKKMQDALTIINKKPGG